MGTLDGKVALVTGGGRGIGLVAACIVGAGCGGMGGLTHAP